MEKTFNLRINMINKNLMISASIISSHLLEIKKNILELDKNKVEFIHFDVMDGNFVPRFGLPPELISFISYLTKIPIEVHLMIINPEPYLEVFIGSGAKIISPHLETLTHPHRTLQKIKKLGAKSGLSLNINTSLTNIEYLLDEIDFITLMGINPGILNHSLIDTVYQKLETLKAYITKSGRDVKIQIDGGVEFSNTEKLYLSGADILVCGSKTLFKNNKIGENIKKLRQMSPKID